MRILVAEDHERVATFLVKGLREEGFTVDLEMTGDAGFERARSDVYDIIVLDVMLPGMDGLEITRRLRDIHNSTAILLLTARDDVRHRVEGLDAGADDYLVKPFAFDELLARLRALLRRGDTRCPPLLSLADLTLDPATHEVTRAGRRLDLTAREYALLEFLLRNKGRVVTRTLIMEHVWAIHFDTSTNVVDVYIRYLRRKVDENFSPPLIHTVRGFGYVLRDETA